MTESEPLNSPVEPVPTPEGAKKPSAGAAADSPSAKAPAASGPAVPPVAAASMEEQLAAAKKEAAGNYDRYVRAMADLENFRRRVAREKEELRQFASASLLQGLLPILSNLQLGVVAARQPTDPKTVADGVAMVLEQLKGVLERHGLKEVNPAGQKFDPHLHEAISHQPSPEVPEEHVMQVVRNGYTLHGRLLQPAAVVVSSGPAKKEAT
jgi:molecular chaperone GrpE